MQQKLKKKKKDFINSVAHPAIMIMVQIWQFYASLPRPRVGHFLRFVSQKFPML